VPDYIVEGATLLAGRPKLGKSWLMLDVGLAVARGGYCLGNIKCYQGDVLYLALEDNERRLQNRITRLIGFATEWPARFHYATEWPRANAGGLEKIRQWIASVERPRLIVVDVLAMFRSPRQRNQEPYESDYAAIKGLQQIASETGVAIVIVHHLRKSVAEVDPFEKVSGTLGLSGAADTVLILDRDGQGATLYGRGRDIEEIESAVEFDKRKCQWRVLGEAQQVRISNERGAVLDALKNAKGAISAQDGADLTGKSYDSIRQMLARLATDGEIVRADRGRYRHWDNAPDVTNGVTTKSRKKTVRDKQQATPCHKSHNVTTDENNNNNKGLDCGSLCDSQDDFYYVESQTKVPCDIVTDVTEGRESQIPFPLRLVGPAQPGLACTFCKGAHGVVLLFRRIDRPGAISQPLHEGCAKAWFEAVP
jgi:AAA domain